MSGLAKVGTVLFKLISFIFFFEVLKEVGKVFDSFEEEMDHKEE